MLKRARSRRLLLLLMMRLLLLLLVRRLLLLLKCVQPFLVEHGHGFIHLLHWPGNPQDGIGALNK